MKTISREEEWKEKAKDEEKAQKMGFAVDECQKQNEHVNNVGNFFRFENQVLKSEKKSSE